MAHPSKRTSRHHRPPTVGVDMVWLKKRFDELERQHVAIIAKLEGKGNVTPELEEQINRAMALSRIIDRKVPDRN